MNLLNIIFKRVCVNLILVDKVMPNIFLGVFVSIISVLLLYRTNGIEDKILSFEKKDIFPISIFLSFGVILVSPLPFEGNGGRLKLVSVTGLLLIYMVTSYTDMKKGEFYLGFLIAGLFLQIILFVISFISKNMYFTTLDVKILIGCVMFNLLLGLIPCGYSLGDMGLIFMSLLSFMILQDGYFFMSFLLIMFVSSVTFLVRNIFLLPKALREERKLRFPYTFHLMLGTMVSLFFLRR